MARMVLWATGSLGCIATLGPWLGHRLDPTRRMATPEMRSVPFDVPDFSLLDHEGQRVGKSDLLGHPWVLDFIFIQCGELSKVLSRRMRDLQELVAMRGTETRHVRFVSFSIDGADEPRALQRYLLSFRHDHDPRWRLLAADERDFPQVALEMGLIDREADVANAFLRKGRFMFLVDKGGTVRGVYDALSEEDARRLAGDLLLQLQEMR